MNSYLALVRVEVLRSLLLVEGDAFQRGAVVPILSVVVAQDAEDTVSFQRAMTAHHQPPFGRFVTLLECGDNKKEVAALYREKTERRSGTSSPHLDAKTWTWSETLDADLIREVFW